MNASAENAIVFKPRVLPVRRGLPAIPLRRDMQPPGPGEPLSQLKPEFRHFMSFDDVGLQATGDGFFSGFAAPVPDEGIRFSFAGTFT